MPKQEFIQVRIDKQTKKETQNVLGALGLDLSAAVKILCKQIVHSGTFPLDIRDINGMRKPQRQILRQAIRKTKASKKSYSSVRSLIKSLDA